MQAPSAHPMHLSLLLAAGHVQRQQSQAKQWHLLLLQTLQHVVSQGDCGKPARLG